MDGRPPRSCVFTHLAQCGHIHSPHDGKNRERGNPRKPFYVELRGPEISRSSDRQRVRQCGLIREGSRLAPCFLHASGRPCSLVEGLIANRNVIAFCPETVSTMTHPPSFTSRLRQFEARWRVLLRRMFSCITCSGLVQTHSCSVRSELFGIAHGFNQQDHESRASRPHSQRWVDHESTSM